MGQQVIVQVGWVIGRSVEQVEGRLGFTYSLAPVAVGAAEELPAGGEGRTYRDGGYEILINFDQAGIAQGVQVTSGLAADKYTLEHWPVILQRMGMMVSQKPDQVLPVARKWRNFQGYGIQIFADGPKGKVWSVRVFKARERTLVQKLLGR